VARHQCIGADFATDFCTMMVRNCLAGWIFIRAGGAYGVCWDAESLRRKGLRIFPNIVSKQARLERRAAPLIAVRCRERVPS